MVRVKSEAYTKTSVKAPRKATVLRTVSGISPKNNGKSGNKYSRGNSYCARPTPAWQKPITNFFSKNGSEEESTEEKDKEDLATCSSANLSEDAPDCSTAISSEDAPGCSTAISSEDAPGCSTAISSEDAPGCSTAISSEDAPGCSRDSSEPIEDVDMPDKDSDEESLPDSLPKGKSNGENCNENYSGESDGS